MEKINKDEEAKNKLISIAEQNEEFAKTFMRLHTPLKATILPGRNDICPFCNSGKKFKKCECYKIKVKEYKNEFS